MLFFDKVSILFYVLTIQNEVLWRQWNIIIIDTYCLSWKSLYTVYTNIVLLLYNNLYTYYYNNYLCEFRSTHFSPLFYSYMRQLMIYWNYFYSYCIFIIIHRRPRRNDEVLINCFWLTDELYDEVSVFFFMLSLAWW